jgi:hypothetical protein
LSAALGIEQRVEFTRERHLGDDVAAADEFALDVKLRDGGPVGIVLDALPDSSSASTFTS